MILKEYLIECCSKVSIFEKSTQSFHFNTLFPLQNNIFQCNFDKGLWDKFKHPDSIQYLFGSISSPQLGKANYAHLRV